MGFLYRLRFWLRFRIPKCHECRGQVICEEQEVEHGSTWCLTCHYNYEYVEEWFSQWDD